MDRYGDRTGGGRCRPDVCTATVYSDRSAGWTRKSTLSSSPPPSDRRTPGTHIHRVIRTDRPAAAIAATTAVRPRFSFVADTIRAEAAGSSWTCVRWCARGRSWPGEASREATLRQHLASVPFFDGMSLRWVAGGVRGVGCSRVPSPGLAARCEPPDCLCLVAEKKARRLQHFLLLKPTPIFVSFQRRKSFSIVGASSLSLSLVSRRIAPRVGDTRLGSSSFPSLVSASS